MNIEELKNIAEDCEFENEKIYVKKNIHKIVEFLKDNYCCKILKSITAVDLGDKIELIYYLFSIDNEEDVILSIKIQNEAESIADIFDSARADENEIFDMFGIKFIGNKDLKRLYMPEDWEGYPLRKDYVQDDTRLAWNDNSDNA